jgi:hypothetical protein
VEILDLVKEFGLPLGLMMIAVVWLVRLLRDILKGELITPRYVYDKALEANAELKAENRELRRDLQRATRLAEQATYDIAAPAVQKVMRDK